MKNDFGVGFKTLTGYTVIWKYLIAPGNQDAFAHAYGNSGIWAELFSSSMDNEGSALRESLYEQGTYLLMDNCSSEEITTSS